MAQARVIRGSVLAGTASDSRRLAGPARHRDRLLGRVGGAGAVRACSTATWCRPILAVGDALWRELVDPKFYRDLVVHLRRGRGRIRRGVPDRRRGRHPARDAQLPAPRLRALSQRHRRHAQDRLPADHLPGVRRRHRIQDGERRAIRLLPGRVLHRARHDADQPGAAAGRAFVQPERMADGHQDLSAGDGRARWSWVFASPWGSR